MDEAKLDWNHLLVALVYRLPTRHAGHISFSLQVADQCAVHTMPFPQAPTIGPRAPFCHFPMTSTGYRVQ
jgi:hypothetical protein